MADARWEEWLRRLREGERLRLYRGRWTRRRATIALIVPLAAVIAEVVTDARGAGLLQLLLLPLVAALLVAGALYEWGRVAHSAVQLFDDHLLLWDYRNRPHRFDYRDLEAVACAKRFPKHATVRVCQRAEDPTGPLRWTAVLTWPWRKQAAAVAKEIARRAGLGQRAEGLWTRAYAEELPPAPSFLE